MVTDQEPRYRLVDPDGNVVGSLFAESDGTLKLQEGTSGNDNEVSLTTQGALEVEEIAVNKAHTLVAAGSSQSIPDGGFTQVEFNDVFTDELTGWNTSSDTFSAPSDGLYEVAATISFGSAPAGTFVLLSVVVNGSQTVKEREDITQGGNMTVAASGTRRLTAGDTVSVDVLQQSGGSLSTLSGVSDTQISITSLG